MDSSRRSAYAWALRQIARRMRTEHEIREGLLRRGLDAETVSGIVGRLREDRYLDDAEFAGQWVRSRSSYRLYGSRKIRQELRRKGVPEGVAEAALADHLPPAREEELARAAVRKKSATVRSGGKERKAVLYRYLMSRGFSTSAVWSALSDSSRQEEVC